MSKSEPIRQYDEPTIRLNCKLADTPLKFSYIPYRHDQSADARTPAGFFSAYSRMPCIVGSRSPSARTLMRSRLVVSQRVARNVERISAAILKLLEQRHNVFRAAELEPL